MMRRTVQKRSGSDFDGTRMSPQEELPQQTRKRSRAVVPSDAAVSASNNDNNNKGAAGDGGMVKEGSLNISKDVRWEQWQAREARVRTLFEGGAIERMSVEELRDEFLKWDPLCKCVGTRGKKTQRTIDCLFPGFPERFALDYQKRTKSSVGCVCFHASILRFQTLECPFVIISRLDANELPEYCCIPLSTTCGASFESLRGFQSDATKVIKTAIDEYGKAVNKECKHPPQKNEVCLNSYPRFVQMVFSKCRDPKAIGRRICDELRRRQNIPSEVIARIWSLAPPGAADVNNDEVPRSLSAALDALSLNQYSAEEFAVPTFPSQTTSGAKMNMPPPSLDMPYDSPFAAPIPPLDGPYHPIATKVDTGPSGGEEDALFSWYFSQVDEAAVRSLFPTQTATTFGGSSGAFDLDVQPVEDSKDPILLDYLDWLASGLHDSTGPDISLLHQLPDDILDNSFFDENGMWAEE